MAEFSKGSSEPVDSNYSGWGVSAIDTRRDRRFAVQSFEIRTKEQALGIVLSRLFYCLSLYHPELTIRVQTFLEKQLDDISSFSFQAISDMLSFYPNSIDGDMGLLKHICSLMDGVKAVEA